jgi:hypothetical protein
MPGDSPIVVIRTLPEWQLTDWENKLRKSGKLAMLNQMAEKVGKHLAEYARDGMSKYLEPGGTYNIGASGAASKNFELKLIKTTGGAVSWSVMEGGGTDANRIIREGIPPGTNVTVAVLKRWVANKGITVMAYEDYTSTKPDPTRKKQTAIWKTVSGYLHGNRSGRVSITRGYARRSGDSGAITGIYAIASAIDKYGSDRPTSNWFERSPYPKGEGRFDYVAWFMKKNKGGLEREGDAAMQKAGTIYVSYLASSQKGRGEVIIGEL